MTALWSDPFGAAGSWYRGCLHCHTTNSDGELSPAQLAEHYRRGGLDFMAVTDHWALTDASALSAERFLVLPGIEYATARTFSAAGTVGHITGIGVSAALPERDDMPAQPLVDHILAHGGLAIVAHPYWSGLTVEDFASVSGYLALEVYNAHVEISRSRGRSSVHWDDLLTRGTVSCAVAVDDSHFPRFDSLKAWTVVRAPSLGREDIMAALRAGHFYSSTGPEILDVRLARADSTPGSASSTGSVTVRCSPARSICLVADGPLGGRVNAGPDGYALRGRMLEETEVVEPGSLSERPRPAVTAAEFTLTGRERYTRVEVEDHVGGIAWSNPLFVQRAAQDHAWRMPGTRRP